MALIETNFIRPQEVYDRNTGESKVRYRSYDGNDRFIPVVDGEKGVPKTMVEVTHAELKAMRDGGKLTAGSLYRITDYNCTTTQENTRSAGHQFDIVLLALSENKLAEEGWAMMHDNIYDVTFTDGVTKKCYYAGQQDARILVLCDSLLGIHSILDEELTIDEINKTIIADYASTDLDTPNLIYNYFQNSNLSAWKVWYCLDNDTDRFAWADDSVDEGTPASVIFNDGGGAIVAIRNANQDTEDYYCWVKRGLETMPYYTEKEIPAVGDMVYQSDHGMIEEIGRRVEVYNPPTQGTGLPNGRGVIYRLIDEFNNDIKYDFKNIQFKRTITDGQYDENGTETWCYTLNLWYDNMCQDASIVGNTLLNDEGYIEGVCDNNFGYATAYDFGIEGVSTFAFALGNNVVLSYYVDYYYGIYSNTIGDRFSSNTIGNNLNSNIIGNYFNGNKIGNYFSSNTIGNTFRNNTIGNNFNGNTIGNFFNGNTISNETMYKNYGNNGVELATKE